MGPAATTISVQGDQNPLLQASLFVDETGILLSICGGEHDECTTLKVSRLFTLYKGQKLTILKLLRKSPGAFPKRHSYHTGSRENDVVVSTVDRYQGDEKDTVTLSLVCTRPGNRLVALRSRFIVATSRARIRFYILGTSGAVVVRRTGVVCSKISKV